MQMCHIAPIWRVVEPYIGVKSCAIYQPIDGTNRGMGSLGKQLWIMD